MTLTLNYLCVSFPGHPARHRVQPVRAGVPAGAAAADVAAGTRAEARRQRGRRVRLLPPAALAPRRRRSAAAGRRLASRREVSALQNIIFNFHLLFFLYLLTSSN